MEKPNGNPSCGKFRRIQGTCFYMNGCTTLWTIALKRLIFKREKGFTNITLGLNCCSMGRTGYVLQSYRFKSFLKLSLFILEIITFCNDLQCNRITGPKNYHSVEIDKMAPIINIDLHIPKLFNGKNVQKISTLLINSK
jgi:hypothetical protein